MFIYLFTWWHWVVVAACGIFRGGVQILWLWCTGCSMQASVVRALRFSSCGTWSWLPCSMWGLSSLTRDQTCIPCIARWILNHWTSREVSFTFLFLVYLSKFIPYWAGSKQQWCPDDLKQQTQSYSIVRHSYVITCGTWRPLTLRVETSSSEFYTV